MTKHYLLPVIALAAIAMTVSCNKNVQENPNRLVDRTFTATYPETKAYLNGLEVNWEATDAVAIMDDKCATVHNFTLTAGADTKVATLSGQVEAAATSFNAVSPASAATTRTEITLPAVQTSGTHNLDPAALISVGATTTEDIALHNAVALLKVTVDVDDITEITLTANDNAALAGKVAINYSTGAFAANSSVSSPVSTLTLRPAGSTFARGDYYLASFPTSTSDFLLKAKTADAQVYYQKTSTKTLSISRNTLTNLGTVSALDYVEPFSIKTIHVISDDTSWNYTDANKMNQTAAGIFEFDFDCTNSTYGHGGSYFYLVYNGNLNNYLNTLESARTRSTTYEGIETITGATTFPLCKDGDAAFHATGATDPQEYFFKILTAADRGVYHLKVDVRDLSNMTLTVTPPAFVVDNIYLVGGTSWDFEDQYKMTKTANGVFEYDLDCSTGTAAYGQYFYLAMNGTTGSSFNGRYEYCLESARTRSTTYETFNHSAAATYALCKKGDAGFQATGAALPNEYFFRTETKADALKYHLVVNITNMTLTMTPIAEPIVPGSASTEDFLDNGNFAW